MASFANGINNLFEKANQIKVHMISHIYLQQFEYSLKRVSHIYSIYKQLHTTVIRLTGIAMFKHVMFKMLENHYTGENSDSLHNP